MSTTILRVPFWTSEINDGVRSIHINRPENRTPATAQAIANYQPSCGCCRGMMQFARP